MFPLLSVFSVVLATLLWGQVSAKTNQTIVQLFEWPHASVGAECASLASAGYGYAQVSPPQEHILGSEWWTDYQPVSYQLNSKRGNRAAFIAMVKTCNAVGIGILVDAVLNHMTAGSGTGFAGSSYSKYNYPAVPYSASHFHYCGSGGNGNNQLQNYNNENQVWNCELLGLADLATDSSPVQTIQAAYLQDLINIGVEGFRIDAAKNMNPNDIGKTLALVKKGLGEPVFLAQEVIFGSGEPVTPQLYVGNGNVIEFRAAYTLKQYFQNSNGNGIANLLNNFPGGGWVASSSAIVFLTNQDTERAGSVITYTSSNNNYALATIFLFSQPYGIPTLYSGYNFTDTKQGPATGTGGLTSSVVCGSNGWRCEQQIPQFIRMTQFYNRMKGQSISQHANPVPSSSSSNQQLSFSRGSIGHVLINNSGQGWNGSFATSLANGKYCDIIHTVCSISVSNGMFTVNVPLYDAVVLM